ncbi:MCE family protein [Jatrophihabitans endophyticus]|uniref:MCE family protein n=1 Tax=Jatrophihabitans endophyticus TaxID=1206085 RepID=UPI0019F4FC28|nr:MCE family protein [Jatrophihabitans endophyticus]MBE7188854.1 MCE family protein [Jatrophihabitans endophyticus]
MRKGRDALIGLGYIVVIAALVALSLAVYNHAFTSYVTVRATVPAGSDSLADGAPVMVRGLQVGELHEITTDGHHVDLHLQLNPTKAHQLPSNLTVQLLPETLFGESYVNLVLPDTPSGTLSSGAVLHQNRSPGTIALEKVFTQLQMVLTIVQPDKLSASLTELADALRGKGKDLGDTVRIIGHYLHGLAPQVPQITDDLNRLVSVAHTYQSAAPDLLRGLAAFKNTSRLLVHRRNDYVGLLTSLTHTGRSFGHFVGTTQNQIIGVAADSRAPLELTRRYASEFPCIARALVTLIPRVNKAFGVGTGHAGARVILHVVHSVRAYSHTPTPFRSGTGPRCPYVAGSQTANTADPVAASDASHTQSTSSTSSTVGTSTSTGATTSDDTSATGVGSVNSPAENRLIAELMAPQAGMTPSQYPGWSSLLVGPALRGAQVVVK